ncbi:hypothetical protein QUB80_22865 [Chlorogloeopsis sp. ULAP01]|uniref:hypothetical protein n=1 Tax=Chlorogloeopsis sp. ULAP01 TaxID=3056483 RepID=UPI0025AAAC65|nr:hypothetical protein [Chlorogloeopsis sp. ULAP01]MDM9383533.1 hypothetical protein [Chlorogloeopsis sp. ULAP01]
MISLELFKIPIICKETIIYLENLSQKANLLSLYQKLFPEQWNESITPLDRKAHPDCIYSDREIEFIQLVDSNLFPVEFVDEIEACDKYEYIPIVPQIIEWWENDFEGLETSEKFLLSVMGNGYQLEYWEEKFGFEPDYIARVEDIDFQKLVKICNKFKSPLQYLATSLSILDYSTGNIWLDTTYETGDWWDWTEENIVFLAQKWQEATIMLDQFQELSDWIKTSVANRNKIIRIWNKAAK